MPLFLNEQLTSLIYKEQYEAIEKSSEIAEKSGVKIYLAGGIVRDIILKNSVKDIDIAVEGDAVEFVKQAENNGILKIIGIQKNLRTTKVKFPSGIEIDFASTREEKYIKSGVLPQAYNFGCSFEKDVLRRDFTINAMGLALTGTEKYMLVDYLNGYDDLQNSLIRILHNKSFYDDPSRIIRAIKFAKRLNFKIETNTLYLIEEYLKNPDKEMPLERIKNELKQYFEIQSDNPFDKINEIKAYRLTESNCTCYADKKRINEVISSKLCKKEEISFVYLVLMILNSNNIERLNFSSREKKIITEVKNLLNEKINPNDDKKIYKIFIDKEKLSAAIYYIICGNQSVKIFYEKLKDIKVLINGNDLIEAGFKPSPKFSEIFDKILEEKIKGNLKTKQDEIIYIKQLG